MNTLSFKELIRTFNKLRLSKIFRTSWLRRQDESGFGMSFTLIIGVCFVVDVLVSSTNKGKRNVKLKSNRTINLTQTLRHVILT